LLPEQAVGLLESSPEFVTAGPQYRRLVSIKWIVQDAPDEPYNYSAKFTWRWTPTAVEAVPQLFESVAEFVSVEGRWSLLDFSDENNRLVQIGLHFDVREGPPPPIPRWELDDVNKSAANGRIQHPQ
jgi:hypothetical protein